MRMTAWTAKSESLILIVVQCDVYSSAETTSVVCVNHAYVSERGRMIYVRGYSCAITSNCTYHCSVVQSTHNSM